MILHPLMNSCAVLALLASSPLLAQDGTEYEPQPDEVLEEPMLEGSILGEIVVTGDRLRSQVDSSQAPILELNEADIAAYGVSSIADLVAALEPSTGTSRGRGGGGQPVFLVNGIRVGSFREFRNYPPEAIRKTEILPEEVAQRYGFAPDRRVINFILKDNYSALTAEVEYEQPQSGGYSRNEQEVTLLKITGGGRLNLDLKASDTSLLTEAERNVIQTPSSIPDVTGDPDPARFRSLVADTAEVVGSASFAKALGNSGASMSANATLGRTHSRSLSGLDTVLLTDPAGTSVLRTFGANDPLERRSTTDSAAVSGSYNQPLGAFQLTATADASLNDSTTEIERRADTSGLVAAAAAGNLAIGGALPGLGDAGFDTADTKVLGASSKLTVRGTPLFLPGGELGTTFDLGYDWNRIESEDTRNTLATQLTRGNLNGGINLAIPIASRREGFLDGAGDISINLSAGFENLSDFGTLYDWSASLIWSPFENLDLSATYVNRESAPSLSQLGSPQITTFNVPTFDFRTGETVLAAITSGGNPFLLAETQSDWKFSANWKVPFIENATAQVDYIRNRSDDVSSSFPLLTSDVEAAFADRVTRDASGQLVAIDRRPVSFDSTAVDRLAFGLSLRGSFGKAKVQERPAGGEGAAGRGSGNGGDRAGRPGAGGPRTGGGRRGGPGGFGGDDGRGRFFININHTLELSNEVLIAPGGPLLDLLDGASLTSSGTPRNATRLEGGMFRNGWGIRASGSYVGPTRIDGSGLPGSTDLFFNDLARLDLRLFADLGEIMNKKDGYLKGLRVSLVADNVFGGIQRVTDQDGNVPLSYQPALVDPKGRYLGIDIRKLF